jgi:ubiquinone/menaquinone biosynthesis C-methylase UbiE
MTDKQAGQYWNASAEAWTTLARAGFDTYRNYLNTPAFFNMLPRVQGLYGIDIGCGEGYNTRLLANRGAAIEAIDISEVFIGKAVEENIARPLNIRYHTGSATDLPFNDGSFDFATSFMCMMDIPEILPAFKEAYRVLKPGGFFQFSITHPCFDTAYRKNLRDAQGNTYAIAIGDYFKKVHGDIDEWIFGSTPAELKQRLGNFRLPRFTRTLSQWINPIVEAGFVIEQMNEPYPDDDAVKQQPSLQDAQVVSYFLHVRCRKHI